MEEIKGEVAIKVAINILFRIAWVHNTHCTTQYLGIYKMSTNCNYKLVIKTSNLCCVFQRKEIQIQMQSKSFQAQ